MRKPGVQGVLLAIWCPLDRVVRGSEARGIVARTNLLPATRTPQSSPGGNGVQNLPSRLWEEKGWGY